jgi:pantothenate kinase
VRPSLLEEARALASGPRRVLGIAGPPGAGKSTVAAALVSALGESAVLVGMDGFHLLDEDLVRLGRSDRKGAPDTFDVDAYVGLLRGLRVAGSTVLAPDFDRITDAPVPDAIEVPPEVPLVVTEGNYLLLDDDPWHLVAPLLDTCWYVDVDERLRVQRLTARHHAHGKTLEAARAWATGSDQSNAELVMTTRDRADRIVTDDEIAALLDR